MSERRSLLRAAVNERLAAAAEEIFVLLERTIAEYEEEVCRSKEQNQRNQQLLEALLTRGSGQRRLYSRLFHVWDKLYIDTSKLSSCCV
ncbi:unnamed protein product [Knipowitschia caucasica]|uniref:Uncharacterized protein n=1 Tax=Knipowitschia caucasica TaxID=637954 RepID=A0AAV2KS24_KNICA